MNNHEKIVFELFTVAFPNADYNRMEATFDKDLVAYVTNPQAGVDKVQGRDIYMKRIRELDIKNAKGEVTIPQIVTVNSNQILVMVDIKLEKDNKKMHNHAAFLINFKNDKISEMWMVDALPAYSAEFWLG